MKNKNIKLIIIPLTIVTIITCIVISMQTYSQYKKISVITNEKISEIIEYIIKENPAIDTKNIIQILNSNEYKDGEEELKKYGINIEEVNSIIAVQKQMKTNIILNIILIVSFNALYMAIIFIYLKQRDKKINQITQYINEIKNRKYDLDINENSEDELSNLKNELYKITIMLKEESEISRQDKENIKMSVEDISHQLKTPLTSIMIMLDNLKDNPNMDEDTKQRFIFEISKQVDWINWLVISILKLSRLEANVVKFSDNKINVKKFIDEIINNLEIPIEIKNQKIIIEGNEDASFIGDYKWQQEAITNIIKNAIEHNKENGKITIKYEENGVRIDEINVISLSKEAHERYISKLGGDYEKYKNGAILIDKNINTNNDGKKIQGNIYTWKKGDIITGKINDTQYNIEILAKTEEIPAGVNILYNPDAFIIVSEDFINRVGYKTIALYYDSKDAYKLDEEIKQYKQENNITDNTIQTFNMEESARAENAVVLVISIFLYGFIGVITLIGITNIFNTITTNMNLRKKEFAMLKSIGMTKKEFNRMIRLESIFYGLKSLIIGIPIGLLLSYGMYNVFRNSMEMEYVLPYKSIVVAVIFVAVVIGIIMKYSMSKINKQNVIETIRNDNI